MTAAVFTKLLAIFATVALGWVAGRMRWLGRPDAGVDPARVLGNAAFYIFVPALLFRTTARLDFGAMPWRTVIAFFVPVLALMLGVYLWQRRHARAGTLPTAAPSARAISASFGNSVQLGIPLASALFGEAGLGIHVALVSLHALVLLSVLTALVELDLARARARHEAAASLAATLKQTVRNTIIHPVVLPVLAGMAWNATGRPIPAVLDETLQVLGSGVVPLCLVLIGISLAYYGVAGHVRGALVQTVLKLLVLPAVVLAVARWGFGLDGLPLAVVVMMAALPVGNNALIFSQRYEAMEGEATAAIVFSTFAFGLSSAFWLAVLAGLGARGG